MKNIRRILTLFLCFFLCILSCNTAKKQKVENLSAFACTYGLVRWFYPSDEAQQVNWNQFALYGVEKVSDCSSTEDLKRELETLFKPIAPGISFSKKEKPEDLSLIVPPDTSGMLLVAWQHSGVDLGLWSNSYISKRINRPLQTRNIGKAALYGNFPVGDYAGDRVKIKARIRRTSPSENVKIFLRLTDEKDASYTLCADTTQVPLVNHGEWNDYEFVLQISDNPKNNNDLFWGIYTEGDGSFSISHVILENATQNKTIKEFIFNKTFEYNLDCRSNERVYEFIPRAEEIEIKTKNLLFEKHADFGEYKSQKLTNGLYVHVPLALLGTEDMTYPATDAESINKLIPNPGQPVSKTTEMQADIIVAWNVIKYFSPYLADLPVNWDEELMKALSQISPKDTSYNMRPLELMMAQLKDAHVFCLGNYKPNGFLPFTIKKTDNQIMVDEPFNTTFRKGDIILKVNGSDALEDFALCEEAVSGCAHYRKGRAEITWLQNYADTKPTAIEIAREKEKQTKKVYLMPQENFYSQLNTFFYGKRPSGWLTNDILYLNVFNTNYNEIKALLAERKPHQTVITDVRYGSSFLFRHIIPLLTIQEHAIKRRNIGLIPEIGYPETPVVKDSLPSVSPPPANKKNLFLTCSGNISNNEEALDYIRYIGLGYLIATTPTAGCCGMINTITLPSEGLVSFTGTKWLSNMGPEHYYYNKGIEPDLYVKETADDIKEGRDAVFEKTFQFAEQQ